MTGSWRAAAGGVSFAVATAVGVVTSLVTAHPSAGLWAALGALVMVGGGLQVVAAVGDRRPEGRVVAGGPGSVAVGRSATEIRTHISGEHGKPAEPGERGGITAAGPGSIAVGGDATGRVQTDVTGPEGQVLG